MQWIGWGHRFGDIDPLITKWRRLLNGLAHIQNNEQAVNKVSSFISKALQHTRASISSILLGVGPDIDMGTAHLQDFDYFSIV